MPDDDQNPDDKFRPEAIAARIDAIGEETEADRAAREEEQKLLVRRKEQKKSGLETAASKRLSRIGEAKVKRPVQAAAQPDGLRDGASRITGWIQKNRTLFTTVVVVGAVGAAAAIGWTSWQDSQGAQASALLASALADEHGRLSATEADDDDDSKAKTLYPTFRSAADRRNAALAKYRTVESKFAGTGPAILARLGEGALLLDAGDAKGAKAAYADVRATPLARADAEVRGRAVEGSGFASELLAQTDAPNKEKYWADALADFKELTGIDTNGFKELGLYHQARVVLAQGDRAKAIELLKDLQKKVADSEGQPFAYLQFVVEDRLRELDPTALPPKAPKTPAAGGGNKADMNDPRIKELLKQLQQGKAPPGGTP